MILKPLEENSRYLISQEGDVYSTYFTPIRKIKKWKSKGYYQVGIWLDGKQQNKTVHRLVARTHIKNPEDKRQVNHKDGNKVNNKSENLEWCTAEENVQHGYDIGLNSSLGVKNSQAKLNEEQVRNIKHLGKSNLLHREIADIFKVSRQCIDQILRGERWAHVK